MGTLYPTMPPYLIPLVPFILFFSFLSLMLPFPIHTYTYIHTCSPSSFLGLIIHTCLPLIPIQTFLETLETPNIIYAYPNKTKQFTLPYVFPNIYHFVFLPFGASTAFIVLPACLCAVRNSSHAMPHPLFVTHIHPHPTTPPHWFALPSWTTFPIYSAHLVVVILCLGTPPSVYTGLLLGHTWDPIATPATLYLGTVLDRDLLLQFRMCCWIPMVPSWRGLVGVHCNHLFCTFPHTPPLFLPCPHPITSYPFITFKHTFYIYCTNFPISYPSPTMYHYLPPHSQLPIPFYYASPLLMPYYYSHSIITFPTCVDDDFGRYWLHLLQLPYVVPTTTFVYLYMLLYLVFTCSLCQPAC